MTDTPSDTSDTTLEQLAASIPTRGPWWWFSFADPEQFLGVCLVRGLTASEALLRAHLLGINPGGEAAFLPLPAELTPPDAYCNRLLTRAEADEVSELMVPDQAGGVH